MDQRLKLLRLLGVSGLAGGVVACLVLAIDVVAESRDAAGASHHHAVAVPWCDGFADATASQFYAEITQVNENMHRGMEIRPSGDIDRDFAQMMIPHHQGAIDMALAELRYGKNEQLRRMAQGMIIEQQQEIAAMRLAAGQPLPRANAPAQAHPAPAIPECK
jgi:Domain of unknown function (DUF305)